MNQERKISIYYNKKIEEYVIANYHTLIEVLEKKYNGKCLLFNYNQTLITPQNFELSTKLTLCRINEIPTLLQKLEAYEAKFNQLANDQQEQKKKTEQLYTDVGENILEREKALKEKVKLLEEENKNLKSQLNDYNAKEQIIQDLQTEYTIAENQFDKLKVENIKLSMENSQLIQLKSESEMLSGDLDNSKIQCQQQLGQIEELRILLDHTSKELYQQKEEVMHFQYESQNLSKELKQSQEKVDNLTIEKQKLTIQLFESKEQINNQNKSSDDQKKVSQKLEETVQKFCTDEQEQEDKQIQGNQIKFQESIIKKLSDEIQLIKDITFQTDRGQFELYEITLKEDQFQQSINEKNFFFRQNCFNKQRYNNYNIQNQQEISLTAKGEEIIIQKLYTFSKSEYQIIDTILNILIVQGYFTLFQRDLQQNSIQQFQQNWNLRIPRQFLIKDQQNSYYVYQEFIKINTKNLLSFQNTSLIEQYISSFFKYFYFATNKNLALTQCEYGESNDNTEIIILNIIIHSKYPKVFSSYDLGKTKIDEFEEMIQAPGGTTQKYWSDQLQSLAKKVWNDSQQK